MNKGTELPANPPHSDPGAEPCAPDREGETRPIRLLIAISTLGGGTGTHLVRLLDRFDPKRWDIHVLCNDRLALELPAHVNLIQDPGRRRLHRFPLAQLREARQFGEVVRRIQPDIVHTYFIWPILYGRLLKLLGLIDHLVENREDLGFNWNPVDYRLLKWTRSVPDRIICVSEAVRETVRRKEIQSDERTVVLYNGIERVSDAAPGSSPHGERGEFGLQPEHLVVGMVANLNRAVKGAGYFIESIPLIAREVPAARFLVVGGGHEGSALRERANALGVEELVVFTGFRPDIDRLYSMMDISVLTSLSEGLSITILESMAHGIPVVATSVGGNPEVVQDGETGLLVPPADPAAFAEAVIRLLEDRDLRLRQGTAAQARATTRFSLREAANNYRHLYEELRETAAANV